jgi:hypothetical protein
MDIPFDDMCAVVRKPGHLAAAFDALRSIGEARIQSPVWRTIETPDIESDIEDAGRWLRETITLYRPTGVYLGLDTLNEDDGAGKNVEIGMTTEADPATLAMEWAWSCEQYGDDHLIRGLYEVHKTYQDAGLEYPASLLADYLFFFGYGGIVLASALERVPVRWNSLFVWGFHDGDIGFLARGSPRGVERLVTFDGA